MDPMGRTSAAKHGDLRIPWRTVSNSLMEHSGHVTGQPAVGLGFQLAGWRMAWFSRNLGGVGLDWLEFHRVSFPALTRSEVSGLLYMCCDYFADKM